MRIHTVAMTLLVLGCANHGSSIDAPYARLELTAAAGQLQLNGSPLDSSYRPTYSNPLGFVAMQVVVGPDGDLVGVCRDAQGGIGECDDVPFFALVSSTAAGRVVQAWDLNGELVVSYSCVDTTDGICGPAGVEEARAQKECDAGSGSGSGGSGSGSGDCPPPPTDCSSMEDWARACFCKRVNESIASFGINYTVDCQGLGSGSDYPKVNVDYEGDLACRGDIINPPEKVVKQPVDHGHCDDAKTALQNWVSSVDYQLRSRGYCGHSPLILDLAGDGVSLTSLAEGTQFDLLGTGSRVACSWTAGTDDAFLVLDRNNNGTIDGASELFGNATDARSFANGFAALAELDADHNGVIDAADPAFGSLKVWNDRNRDGIASPAELRTLEQAGVKTLSLTATRVVGHAAWDGRGNRIPLISEFTRTDGTRSALVDAFLRYAPPEMNNLANQTKE
jgi:hypothetical protein